MVDHQPWKLSTRNIKEADTGTPHESVFNEVNLDSVVCMNIVLYVSMASLCFKYQYLKRCTHHLSPVQQSESIA